MRRFDTLPSGCWVFVIAMVPGYPRWQAPAPPVAAYQFKAGTHRPKKHEDLRGRDLQNSLIADFAFEAHRRPPKVAEHRADAEPWASNRIALRTCHPPGGGCEVLNPGESCRGIDPLGSGIPWVLKNLMPTGGREPIV